MVSASVEDTLNNHCNFLPRMLSSLVLYIEYWMRSLATVSGESDGNVLFHDIHPKKQMEWVSAVINKLLILYHLYQWPYGHLIQLPPAADQQVSDRFVLVR